MTRKYYRAIARCFSQAHEHQAISGDYNEGWHAALSAVMLKIAYEMKRDNARFDHSRFVDACNKYPEAA